MQDIYYSSEGKAKLIKGVNLVLDDIKELWGTLGKYDDEIRVPCIKKIFFGDKEPTKILSISSKKIMISNFRFNEMFILEKQNFFHRDIRFPNGYNYDLMYDFLNEYEEIRKVIEEKVKDIIYGTSLSFDAVDAVLKKYDKEASVEVDVPTQNQQQLKVSRENGKTVGILDFGDRTIKVITNGSIVLVNRNEEELERIVPKKRM